MSPEEAYEPSSQTGVVYFLVDLAWTLFLLLVAALIVAGIVGAIRGTGNVLLGGEKVTVHAQLVRTEIKPLPSGVGLSFPLGLILAGMGAFILAAVFAYGVRLSEGVQATV